MAPISGVSYVVAAFLITWAALLGYVLHLNGRARAARESLARETAGATPSGDLA